MVREVGAVVVAEVDCFCAVAGELVRGCAADTEEGVGSRYDYHFVFYSSVCAGWFLLVSRYTYLCLREKWE